MRLSDFKSLWFIASQLVPFWTIGPALLLSCCGKYLQGTCIASFAYNSKHYLTELCDSCATSADDEERIYQFAFFRCLLLRVFPFYAQATHRIKTWAHQNRKHLIKITLGISSSLISVIGLLSNSAVVVDSRVTALRGVEC